MFPCPRWKHPHLTEAKRDKCIVETNRKSADKKLKRFGYQAPPQKPYHHFPGKPDTINGLPVVRFSGSEILPFWRLDLLDI